MTREISFPYVFSYSIFTDAFNLSIKTHLPCRVFYGPGGPYALFAGKDASRALAKMSFEEKDLTGDVSGLGPFELEALQDWEHKFMSKYVKVGTVRQPGEAAESTDLDVAKPAEDGPSESAPIITEEAPAADHATKEE